MTDRIQVAIVGTGCIGTSIGLALSQSDQPFYIVGHDKDLSHAKTARKLKAVDKTDWNLIGACEGADVIVLAIPMNGIEDTLRAVAPHLKEGCVVTDTATLKGQVVTWAEEILPETVSSGAMRVRLSGTVLGSNSSASLSCLVSWISSSAPLPIADVMTACPLFSISISILAIS